MSDQSEQLPVEGRATPNESAFFPSLDRFNAFSDGVFAIAITLLVLELPVPPENVAVLPALQRQLA